MVIADSIQVGFAFVQNWYYFRYGNGCLVLINDTSKSWLLAIIIQRTKRAVRFNQIQEINGGTQTWVLIKAINALSKGSSFAVTKRNRNGGGCRKTNITAHHSAKVNCQISLNYPISPSGCTWRIERRTGTKTLWLWASELVIAIWWHPYRALHDRNK